MRLDEEIFKALKDGYNVEIKARCFRCEQDIQSIEFILRNPESEVAAGYKVSLYDLNPALFYSIEAGYEEIFNRLREKITRQEIEGHAN